MSIPICLGGILTSYLSSSVTFVVSDELRLASSKLAKPSVRARIVSPRWVVECCEKRRLLPRSPLPPQKQRQKRQKQQKQNQQQQQQQQTLIDTFFVQRPHKKTKTDETKAILLDTQTSNLKADDLETIDNKNQKNGCEEQNQSLHQRHRTTSSTKRKRFSRLFEANRNDAIKSLPKAHKR